MKEHDNKRLSLLNKRLSLLCICSYSYRALLYRKGETTCHRHVTAAKVDLTVTSIEIGAFNGWCSLITITLPYTITTIGDWVFSGCSSLISITLPSNTTTLGDWVFSGCSSLASITLPSTITTLGEGAFYECSSLSSITIPSNITTLRRSVFYGCSSLASITLPSTITTLGNCVFSGCSSLSSIALPSTITTLGDRVFSDCSSLTSITLSSKITTLGEYVFYGCSSLVSVRLPENLISISLRTFQGCNKLTTIKASSFSTTTLVNKKPDGFKEILMKAGFSTSNPDEIIFDRHFMYQEQDLYYDWKNWARTRNMNDRFPLFNAAAMCLKWSHMKQIFTLNMPVVNEIDVLTGLPLFMLAATGSTCDIESVYNLLKECPSAMNIMNNRHDIHSTERTRNRGGCSTRVVLYWV